ncbi:MAG: arsenate reductase family protein [Eubacteriales bacterium]|jgi:arsenate reductase
MNIQIYGKSKCFDTKKAERYFKERGVKFQSIDLPRYGMSRRELISVVQAVGGLDRLIDEKAKDAVLLKYLAYEEDKLDKVLENPSLLKTPIVRNGKFATVGYCPDIWKGWD